MSVTDYSFHSVRVLHSTGYKPRTHRALFSTNPDLFTPSVCFHIPCNSNSSFSHFLGRSTSCNYTVRSSCGLQFQSPNCSGYWVTRRTPASYVAQLNMTHLLQPSNLACKNNCSRNPVVQILSDDGFGALTSHVWICRSQVYQLLPPGWCGVCHLGYLLPDIRVLKNFSHTGKPQTYSHYYPPHKHHKHSTSVRISGGRKFLSGILPWNGAPANAYEIDRVAADLENLTALITEDFLSLTLELKAIANTVMQNRMALDQLLAAQGGVCHIIGTECCTYIPDVTDNMTHVVSHLNKLLHHQQASDTDVLPSADWWTWLTAGGWRHLVAKIATALALVIILLLLFTCCVVPLVKRLVSSIFAAQMAQYIPIPATDHAKPDLYPIPDYDNHYSSDSGDEESSMI